jgi:hypothetical protein
MPGTFECHSLLELLRQEDQALHIMQRRLRQSIDVSLCPIMSPATEETPGNNTATRLFITNVKRTFIQMSLGMQHKRR